ncbi:unnamed protein product [Paramecium sonneborni]|uniref:Uncharacterized protein n=1 Tax=Paramecium sonneborni TaxID=65129 RepID=A0A8S1RNA2_9CILI|nr:unnamed protein product [Paramecium sonneborni]
MKENEKKMCNIDFVNKNGQIEQDMKLININIGLIEPHIKQNWHNLMGKENMYELMDDSMKDNYFLDLSMNIKYINGYMGNHIKKSLKNDKNDSFGVYTWACGKRFEGSFTEGLQNARGTLGKGKKMQWLDENSELQKVQQ